jgi:hypothetical protein
MSTTVVFECKVRDRSGQVVLLNSKTFSSKFSPGYCLGMSIDWAKTTLTIGEVKALALMHPVEWPVIQSAYEVAAKLHGNNPDAISAIEGHGLTVTNFDGPDSKGNEIPFNHDFQVLAQQLATRVGTYITYLGGGPGKGGHFMGFRRKGAGTFIMGEWFDPNDCLMRVDTEREWAGYIEGTLDYSYSGGPTSHGDLREYCCIAQVEKQIPSSMATTTAQGMGKARFAAARNAFNKKPIV